MLRWPKLLALTICLASLGAEAAPPAPKLPTGACAGIVKNSALIAFGPGQSSNDRVLSHASFYLDFDNQVSYIALTGSSIKNGEAEASGSLFISPGLPFTIRPSSTAPYALEGVFQTLDGDDSTVLEDGTVLNDGSIEETPYRAIPVNGGTSFFIEVLGNNLLTGICQKI